MANPKKRHEFESSFGNNGKSPKRPKLEVIQRPSTSASRNESFENVDENDDLWGDELENDAVEEVLLLESQACTLKVQTHKTEPCQNVASGVFKPKTAVISSKKSEFVSTKDLDTRNVSKASGSGIGLKGTASREHGAFTTPVPVSHAIQPLLVEKVKSNTIGKGCQRSSSMPSITSSHSSSTSSSKPWSEIKDFTRKTISLTPTKDGNRPAGSSREAESEEDDICMTLRKEVERLRSEAYTKAGEAALLRQNIKDAGLELEKEKQHRVELLEKSNEKHQQEAAALKRELEAAKTQLQFKELDVDKAEEKCKLLEAGTIKVRPLELKHQSPARPSTSSDFPNRSMFEGNTPRKRPSLDTKKKLEVKSPEVLEPEVKSQKPKDPEPVEMEATEVGIQKENLFTIPQNISAIQFSKFPEGERLSRLVVPYWFEMDSGATEEQFESKWEGIAAVNELFKMYTIGGKSLDRTIDWCWKRMLTFLSLLRKKSEDDYRLHEIQEEDRRQYEEWCLDRRIPLPPQKQSIDEGLQEDWFCEFAEEAVGEELQGLLSYRPWCPKDVMPEIRRTLALTIALMKASNNAAPILGSHNKNSENESENCVICGGVEVCEGNASSKDNKKSVITSEMPHSSKDIILKDIQGPATDSEVLQKSKQTGESDTGVHTGETVNVDEIGQKETTRDNYNAKAPDSETDENVHMDPKDILKFDFVHLVQQICKVVSGMRCILPMEGTLAAVLVFLSSLNEQLVLSRRGLLLVSAVIKDILFIRPRLRVLIHLMRLLTVTGRHSLILQKLCINSAWNTAYRDRWKNIWMFTSGVCPLQILITILENVTDERIPNGVIQEIWFKYRVKIGLSFFRWLNAAFTQPGHKVDWLCYALRDDDYEDELIRDENSNTHQEERHTSDSTGRGEIGAEKDSVECENVGGKNALPEEEEMKMEGSCKGEEETKRIPCKKPSKLSNSKKISGESEEDMEEMEESSKRCCCRRWMMNIIVNILYAIVSDFKAIDQSGYKQEWNEYPTASLGKIGDKIVNRRLVWDQSHCLKLGIFVMRELLRRGHPEFNTPGGEGFLWNHYTSKGTILINGQIEMKNYSHKNTHGGPMGGRYVLLLTSIDRGLKNKIEDFSAETEKALQELLEVEYSLQVSSESEEDEFNMWDRINTSGCNDMNT